MINPVTLAKQLRRSAAALREHSDLVPSFSDLANRILLAATLLDQSPNPITAKRCEEILWAAALNAKGHETNRTALTENGQRYVREDVAVDSMMRVARGEQ